jgi:hypothetical protein
MASKAARSLGVLRDPDHVVAAEGHVTSGELALMRGADLRNSLDRFREFLIGPVFDYFDPDYVRWHWSS